MTLNFYDEYKNYSNIELLKIIKRPDDYQPTAVEAAKQILQERTVSEDEVSEADNYYQSINKAKQLKKDKVDVYKEKVTDFLEPVVKPGPEVSPAKWVNILLVAITLQYVWSLFNTARSLISFLKCKTCRFEIITFLPFVSLVYVPVIFYLLFKKRRWGWILLFADNLFVLILQLDNLSILFQPWVPHGINVFSLLWPIFLRILFAFFLWRKDITAFFGVNDKTKKQTAATATLLALGFIAGMIILF
jgi:hypothetical protein